MRVGQSDITPWKEMCFQELLESFMESAKYPLNAAIEKHRPALFHLYDLYAGTGVNKYGDGSTTIFYNKLNCVGGLSGRYNLTAVEKCKNNHAALVNNLAPISKDITILNGSAAKAILNIPNKIKNHFGEIPAKAVGAVFLDPNGVVKEPEHSALVALSCLCPNISIVANMSVQQLNRNRGVKEIAGFDIYNEIGQLWSGWKLKMNKRHLYIRNIVKGGRHKWTIAVLTNQSLRGITTVLKDCGFHNVKSEAGLRLLSQIDKRQKTIFEVIK